MQPPGDYLLETREGKLSRGEKVAIVSLYAACVAALGGFIAYNSTRPVDEQANYAARNSCGDAESVVKIEKLPIATKKEQVEELGETIKILQERCKGNTSKAVKRLEKVKAKWETSLQKGGLVKGKPVSDLRWKPKPQRPDFKSPPQKLARSRC